MQVPLQVLVVDDNVDGAEAIAALFELEGHATEVVHNGMLVIAAARRSLPNLILMDLGLPGLDGFAVATQIRLEPLLSGTLLVALTGWGRDADKKAAMDAGFDLHLLKPISMDELRELIARASQQRRSALRGGLSRNCRLVARMRHH